MSDAPLILIVEDKVEMRRFLRSSLGLKGFRCLEAESGQQGLLQAAPHLPDVILLDLGLPDMDGLEVTRRLREWSRIPIIVISARGQERDKIEALDAGADDYLTKPFGLGELLARVRVALRHAAQAQGTVTLEFQVGDIRVDLARRQVWKAGVELRLTPIEYRLLAYLVRHAGKVVTHRQLLREVWGPDAVGETQYLRVFMSQLRHKLEDQPARPRFLRTEVGVGYRLMVDVSE